MKLRPLQTGGHAYILTGLLAASLFVSSALPVWAARFTDLSGNWSEKYVNALSDAGVISAEADGKFRANEPVTRAQLAAWLVKTLGIDNQSVPPTPSFSDVKPSDWYYKAVEIAKQNNYIAGYPDGFRPKQFMQRGEMISIIARSLNTPVPDSGTVVKTLSKYPDKAKIPDWARTGMAQAELAGILTSKDNDATADAAAIATRGDTAAILAKLSDYRSDLAVKQALANPNQNSANNTNSTATRTPSGYAPSQNTATGNNVTGINAIGNNANYGNQNPYYMGQPPQQIAQGGYGQQGYPPPQGNWQGQVQTGQGQYPGPGQPETFGSQSPLQFQQQTPQYANNGYQGGPPLSGRVVVVGAGTQFQATLRNTLDSGSTVVGEPVEATLSAPIYSGGMEVVPAGSRVLGSVTNVVSAKRFRFGANGRIDIRFNSVETPDGRRFPLTASVNDTQIKLVGGSTAGRVGKGALTTAVGAGSGAALGTALGAIVGATSRGQVGRATGMGAVFGTAIGGGVGLVGAGVRKGSEVKITSGTPLPVQLDESMQVTTGGGGYQQPYQPQGGYPPQQQQYQQPPQQYQQPYQQGGYPQQQPYQNPYGQQ